MKHSFISCLLLLLICLTNCTEDEFLSTTYLTTDLELETYSISDPKVPTLDKVITNGSKVTLEFINHAAPKKPEGGFELMLNGKRTATNITPRLHSGQKKLTMSFTLKNPAAHRFQIFARWNSGYVRSNEKGATENGETTQELEQEEETTPNTVTPPSNPKQPVISNITFNGSKVILEFVNFSAPAKPEGGFELMLNGKRTAHDIVPRLHSTQKNLTMSFTLDNPQNYYYQIYARWNSGYLSSEKFYPGQANNSDGNPNEGNSDSDSNIENMPSLSSFRLLTDYSFENNIGRDVEWRRDGLKLQHQSREDGKVVSEDGRGVYHFRVTPGSYNRNDYSHRHELIPRSLPSPYFTKGFISNWNQEYVYEMKVKLSKNYKIGSEYVALFEAKNDYSGTRNASFTLYTEGDHYLIKHAYSRRETNRVAGEGGKKVYYDANGKELTPGVNYHKTKKVGAGYAKITEDMGKWVSWTFHIKWAYDDSGFIKIYKDGKLFHSYYGPNSFKDELAPYVIFGLYNSWWKNGQRTGSTEQELYVDHFRVYVPK